MVFQIGYKQGRKEKNPTWKGTKAKYRSIHSWIVRNYGNASRCTVCKAKNKNLYEWANKDHKYSRNIKDWIMMCRGCHMRYDYRNGFRTQQANKEIRHGVFKVHSGTRQEMCKML